MNLRIFEYNKGVFLVVLQELHLNLSVGSFIYTILDYKTDFVEAMFLLYKKTRDNQLTILLTSDTFLLQ